MSAQDFLILIVQAVCLFSPGKPKELLDSYQENQSIFFHYGSADYVFFFFLKSLFKKLQMEQQQKTDV